MNWNVHCVGIWMSYMKWNFVKYEMLSWMCTNDGVGYLVILLGLSLGCYVGIEAHANMQ